MTDPETEALCIFMERLMAMRPNSNKVTVLKPDLRALIVAVRSAHGAKAKKPSARG
jgi:hypothetical protein